VTALAVVAFLGIRCLLVWNSPVELYHPEEYLAFGLWRDIESGNGLQPLTAYSYGTGRGLDGGGSLVQALIAVPFCWLLGGSYWAVKSIALAWAMTTMALVVILGRRFLGAWGGAAAALGMLCLPPAYLVYSSCTWGRHAEGAAVALAAYVLADWIGTGTRSVWAWICLGFFVPFGAWYSVLGMLPALALVVVAGRSLLPRGRAEGAALALGGTLAAVAPLLAGSSPSELGASAMAAVEQAGTAPNRIRAALWALGEIPTYDVDWPGRTVLPRPWSGPAGLGFLVLGFGGLVDLVSAGARHPDLRRRVAAALLASTVLLPVLLGYAGLVQDNRLTPVLPALGLGIGCLLHRVHRWAERRGRSPVIVAPLVLSALWPSVRLVSGGSPPETSYQPGTFAAPLGAAGPIVSNVGREHVPVLGRLVSVHTDPQDLAALVAGFEAITGGARDPLRLRSAHCPDDPMSYTRQWMVRPEWTDRSWRAWGLTLGAVCDAEADSRCASAPPGSPQVECRRGLGGDL
jgi:hypothetical protein